MKSYLTSFIFLIHLFVLGQYVPNPDPHRFQAEIDNFVAWDAKNSFPENAVLFAGSSSIRMWKTHDAFPDLTVINRGFGGAQISDMIYYFNEAVGKYHPQLIVFYCGDNDIDFGKSAEQTFKDFTTFVHRVDSVRPALPLIYLPAKPSPLRWKLFPEMKKLNEMVEVFANQNENVIYVDLAEPMLNQQGNPRGELFQPDSLHLNDTGYRLWNTLVKPVIQQALK